MEFKAQRWHVDFPDVEYPLSYAKRESAEREAKAWNGIFYLCDCKDRECEFPHGDAS